MSYEDILTLPEHLVGETLYGQLHPHPRPSPKHARSCSALGYLIGGPFDGAIEGPVGWWIIDEPLLHPGSDIIEPDIAGWRRERLPQLPETAWFAICPDWACDNFTGSEIGPPEAGLEGEPRGRGEQILSPSAARTGRAIKMPLFAREGVSCLWLVDPDARTLEVYRRRDDGIGCCSRPSRTTMRCDNRRLKR